MPSEATPQSCQLVNFGGNLHIRAQCYQPASEAEVLGILGRHARGTIRALASRHSWSETVTGADVLVDVARLDRIEMVEVDGEPRARVGAGCRLRQVLDHLHAHTGRTLPTLGVITRQTIAGAISTGTHGSGRPTLAHYVTRVRLAGYDPVDGTPRVFELTGGEELSAARCAIGCMGIILSVDLATVPRYDVAETLHSHDDLESVLATFERRPLTQFLLSPYGWGWTAFEREARPARPPSVMGWIASRAWRAYNTVLVDILFHAAIKATRALGGRAVKLFQRAGPALLLKGIERVDDAERVLTMGHHYFRHEEMELTVAERDLPRAVAILRAVVETLSGEPSTASAETMAAIAAAGLAQDLEASRSAYVLHYPIFFRRVPPDDAMLALGSDTSEPRISISLFSYDPPGKRAGYYTLCRLVAVVLNRAVAARPHWGKHFPLTLEDIGRLYPRLGPFRAICARSDPHGVFRNPFTAAVLGLEPGNNSRAPER